MTLPRKLIRLLNGLAILAALLLAFAPGINQLRLNSAAHWTELCTTEGLRRVQVPADAHDSASPGQQQPHPDCGYCPLQAGTPPTIPLLKITVPARPSVSVILPAYASPYLGNTNSPQLGSRGPPQVL